MTIAPEDFAFICNLVQQKSGIALEPGKEYLVESRLIPILRQQAMAGIPDLVRAVRARTVPDLERRVVDAMTTNETSFFRDVHPFEALKTTVIPQLIARRQAVKQLNFWCAASSTGQEPYSICMVLREHFPTLANWRVNFIATDINRDVLGKAREGRYSQIEVNRGLPVTLLVKYFAKQGLDWQVREDLRRMVDFRELNLTGPWPAMPPMDLVFIRNVLIYFNTPTKAQILNRIRELMRPDGYLFLGGAETTLNVADAYERVALDKTGCYRKTAA